MWTTALLCRGVLWYKPPLTRTRKVHWTNNKTWMINLINLSTKLLKARTQEHRPLEPFQDSNWETRHSERLSYFEIREVVTWGLRFLKQSATPRDSWSRTKLIWLHRGRHKDDLPGSERSESLSCPTSVARSALGRGKKYISSFVKRRKSSMSAPRSWTWQDWFSDVQCIKAEALVHKSVHECTWSVIVASYCLSCSNGHDGGLINHNVAEARKLLRLCQKPRENVTCSNWTCFRERSCGPGVATCGKKNENKLCHFILLQFHVVLGFSL